MTTIAEQFVCEECNVAKEPQHFGFKSGYRGRNPICRQCVRARVANARRARVAEQQRPGMWYAETDQAVCKCDACHAVKGMEEFGRSSTGGGGGTRWRYTTCKLCKIERRHKRQTPREWKEPKTGRVCELWLCRLCAAVGIISPTPKGKRCPWHGVNQ